MLRDENVYLKTKIKRKEDEENAAKERPEIVKEENKSEESVNEVQPEEDDKNGPAGDSMLQVGEDKLGMEYLAFIEHQNKDLEEKVGAEVENLKQKTAVHNEQIEVLERKGEGRC